MPSRASATRYARALFDVALKESDPARSDAISRQFADLMSSNAELHGALDQPRDPGSAKRADRRRRSPTRLTSSAPARKLLLLLADRDRLAVVPDLLAVYRERLMEHQQVVRAEVTTAAPLTRRSLRRSCSSSSRTITGRTVDMTTSVDPSIIGGMVTRIGGTVYDGSIATQLAKLRQTLVAAFSSEDMDIRADEISKIIRDQIGSYAVDGRRRRSRHASSRSATASRACTASSARWPARCSSSRTACSASR